MIDYQKELNESQYRVVTEGDGPVLVLAGAGSGKTRTLTYRVAYLIEQGILPDRILLLTFTNKAAQEMLSRVAELMKDKVSTSGKSQASGLWGGTFHHVAHRLLRTMGSAVNLKPNFTILDREDARDVIKRAVKEVSGNAPKRRLPQPGVFQEVISYASNAQISVEDAVAAKYPEGLDILPIMQRVAGLYKEKKQRSNTLDFDDLLLYWLQLLSIPAIRTKLSNQWQYILVDEYQDTNTVQDDIVRSLATKFNNVLVVGDDAQSIYSFRAANVNNILSFPKNFPEAKI